MTSSIASAVSYHKQLIQYSRVQQCPSLIILLGFSPPPGRSGSPLMVDIDDGLQSGSSSSRHRSRISSRVNPEFTEQHHATSSNSNSSSNNDSKKPNRRAMFPKEVTAILREWLMANLQVSFLVDLRIGNTSELQLFD